VTNAPQGLLRNLAVAGWRDSWAASCSTGSASRLCRAFLAGSSLPPVGAVVFLLIWAGDPPGLKGRCRLAVRPCNP
jgi:hypothetical protein